jgi:hypothetical protein
VDTIPGLRVDDSNAARYSNEDEGMFYCLTTSVHRVALNFLRAPVRFSLSHEFSGFRRFDST